jgi:hypothetical protein
VTARDTATRLAEAQERAAAMEKRLGLASAASDRATPGGRTGYDPAILSGIRRKPNHKADARRFAAYDREAAAWRELEAQRDEVRRLEAMHRREVRDAEAPRDVESLEPGHYVRDSSGWHRVVRVNAKSVSVETGYSWVDRIALDRIIETRCA